MPLVNPPAEEKPAGATGNPVKDVPLGGGIVAASNFGVTQLTGTTDVMLGGAGLFLLFQWVKNFSFIDQRKHAPILLLLLGLGLSVAVAVFVSHTEAGQAVWRGFGMAVQAWLNWLGGRVGGFPGMPSAVDPAEKGGP